jgi:SAM-dependent methyltransferase
LLDVPHGLRRSAHRSEDAWLRSAIDLIELICRVTGRVDLSETSVLDVGCGTKITKALLEQDLPIARYVGVDVSAPVIDFLQANVHDDRFSYHHIDVQNDLYNPDGLPLVDRSELPVADERFDVIWLFSVFTHLAPTDFRAMLLLLRKYVVADGWLVFSVFVNEATQSGIGPVDWRLQQAAGGRRAAMAHEFSRLGEERGQAWLEDRLRTWLDTLDDEQRRAAEARFLEAAQGPKPDTEPPAHAFIDESLELRTSGEPPDFVDLLPHKPLMEPLYSRRHAYELLDGTGWEVVALNPPEAPYIQHYFVCRPS